MIPRLSVKAPVEHISFTHRNDYAAPFKWGDVAWYSLGPRPGDIGHSAILGHLDSYCCAAVFYKLKYLHAGDKASVRYRDGRTLWFRVMWEHSYTNNRLPMKFIFGPARQRVLILMTCTGDFHRDGTGYDHKLVVYLRFIYPNGKLG